MQDSIRITTATMPPPPPQNPTVHSIHETGHLPEIKPSESNNIKSDVVSARKSDETAAAVGRSNSLELNKRKEVKDEEEGTCATTVPPKSNGTVDEAAGSSSGRERLKRHRVDVAGRVWIPDMWGQEDFLKDWIDCAAFDASLVNSSIMLARDSLMGKGRRANSTILRIQNGC